MTPEQAIQNLENLVNVSLQRGIFQSVGDVEAMVESLNVLRSGAGVIQGGFGGQMPGYVTTSSADNIGEQKDAKN